MSERVDPNTLLSLSRLSTELWGVLDPLGRFLQANPVWEDQLGRSPLELEAHPFLDLLHPEDLSVSQSAFRSLQEGKELSTFEARCRRKDGDWLWVRWTIAREKDDPRFFLVGREIQTLKLAERDLRESQSKFERLSDSATEGIAIHEKAVILEANQALARLLGYERAEEVIGKNGLDLVAPEFRELIMDRIRTGNTEPYEVMGIRKDGSRFNCQVQGKPIQYHGRQARVSTFLDVTKIKKREQDLYESQELFRKLVDTSKDGIAVSERGVILMVNPALAQMFGSTVPEMIGHNALEYAAPEFRESLLKKVLDQVETTYEIMGLRKDGSRFPIEITPRMTSYQGRSVRLAFFRDITQRKRIEEEVLRQKEFSQNLINSSGDGLLAFDAERRYTLWNPAMERITGHSREEVLGQVAFEVFPFLKQIGEDTHFESALQGKTTFMPERPYRTPAGRQGFFEAQYMPIKNAKGEILGGLGIIRDVTERKNTQEALRQSEMNLKAVFQNTFQNIVLVDREGRIQAFNNNALVCNRQWTGKDLRIGLSINEFVSEGNQALFHSRFQRALQGEAIHHEQCYHLGGEDQWLEVSYNPVFGEQGEIEGICLVSNSIDDRKRAEEALQRSEADLRAIFESSHQSIILIGKDGLVRDFNQKALEGIQASRGMRLETGRPMVEYVEPEHRKNFQDRIQRVLWGQVTRVERPVRGVDGTDHWFEFHYYPVLDHAGRVEGACLVANAIDERKKAEEAIRENEEKFRRVFEDAAMPMAMVSDLRYLKVNRAFLELLGYQEQELLGRHLLEITHPEDREESRKISQPVHQGVCDRFEAEKRYLRKNGESVWVHLFGTVIRDGQGKPMYSLVMVENIQERKLAEEALQRSEADLRAVFNTVDQSVVLLSIAGVIQSFNEKAAEGFRGSSGKELEKGRAFSDYVRSADHPLFRKNFSVALEGIKVSLERVYRGADGQEHWYEFAYNPVVGQDGKVRGVCFVSQQIDERKKAEQDLRRSEAELRAVFNSGSQVTVLIRPDGTVQDFNRMAGLMAEKVLGRSLEKGMPFIDTLPMGASKDLFQESFQAALDGKGSKGERSIRSADGQPRWVEVGYQPAVNPQGGVEGVCFTLSFIDERKRAQEALRESQERFERLVLVTNEGILLHENPKVVDVNPALAAMVGYKPEEMIGRSGFDFLAPESHPVARQHMVAGSTQPYEALALRKDGTVFPVELRGGNFHYKGKDLRVISVRDMTWHKAAERILTESEERYRRLVELAPSAVVVHAGGDVLYVNPAGLQLFGAEGRDPREFDLLTFLHPDYRELALQRIHQIQRTGQSTDWVEQRLLRLDGTEFLAETKGTPFLYKGVPAVLTIVRDLTDRKKTEETLLRYERLAAVGKVIAGIAHEVRNPLAVLTGMVQLLKVKMEGRGEYKEEFKTIQAQADRLKFFMNDILDFSREMQIKKERTDLGALIEESLAAAQVQVGARADGVRTETRIPRTLKPIPIDRQRIEQVLINLLTNALQAVGERGRVAMAVQQKEGWTRISIQDDGPGISESDLTRLFEPFFTTKKGGSGLGLPISQKIVEAHGGKILVERLDPHGTRFDVSLPNE